MSRKFATLLLILCFVLGFFFGKKINFHKIINDEYFESEFENEMENKNICNNIKIFTGIFYSLQDLIINGGIMSNQINFICQCFDCVSHKIDQNLKDLIGTKKIIAKIDEIILHEINVDKNLSKRLSFLNKFYFLRINDEISSIQNKNDLIKSLFILQNKIRDFDHNKALFIAEIIINSGEITSDQTKEQIMKIKKEIEFDLAINAILRN